ncbi:MAG: hypothetical protein ACF8QF_11375 [Phycisphaerales bacterium]
MPHPIAHETAVRWTRLAWIGVVAAGVVAVGAPLLPAPEVREPAVPDAQPILAQPGQTGAADESAIPDVAWSELADALEAVHIGERPEQVAIEDDPGQVEQTQETDPGQTQQAAEQQGLPGWRYVGDVELGGRLVAVLSVSGAQVYLGEGEEAQGFTIAEVEPTHVVAEGRNGRFRIERERPPQAVLRSAPMRSNPMRQMEEAQRMRDQRLREPEEQR